MDEHDDNGPAARSRELEAKVERLEAEVRNQRDALEHVRRVLEDRTEQLALVSRYRSEVLARMSHEVRTPLNSILILGQQLSENPEGNLTARQIAFGRTIHGAGSDLLNLFSEIIDLRKLEGGIVTVEAENVSFASLGDTLARMFRHEAEHRRLSYEVRIDPELGRSMYTDAKRLQQILRNLISNAFKFTEHGGVRLLASRASSGWSPDHPVLGSARVVVAFEVSDTGIGIPPEKQRIVFEAFQQADAGTTRKYGGTGIGLAIGGALTALLGGELQLRSMPGMGSAFTLYLPFTYVGPQHARCIETAPGVIAPAASDHRDLEGRTVLVVDDDMRCIFALSSVLERYGMNVLTAHTGHEAIAVLEEAPDVGIVLMGIMMPEMDGYETMQMIRKNPALRGLPIVAVTAQAMTGDREKCLQAGASDYLAKPLDIDQLLATLRSWLRR